MKTAQLSLSALLALTLSLTGCSNDENLPGGENDGRVAIRVSSNIDVTDGASKPGTRAANDAWEANDAIGIFMLNGLTADTYSNIAYTTATATAPSLRKAPPSTCRWTAPAVTSWLITPIRAG